MLKELISLFRAKQPLQEVGQEFNDMLGLTLELVRQGGDIYFAGDRSAERREAVYKQDVRVNKFQRQIRKKVLIHLSVQNNSPELPYCLLLMSLVKDVERIGDYAKELVDLAALAEEPLPEDDLVAQLLQIRSRLEEDFTQALDVLAEADSARAVTLINQGREVVDHCEALTANISRSRYSANLATNLTLATHYYERIASHTLNLLSSLVVPLHKLDYYDEKDISRFHEQQAGASTD